MISKEDIEKAKERINKRLTIEKYTKNIATPIHINDLKTVLEYIEQLETEKENLIKKLEEDSKQFDEETKEIAIKLNNARDFISTDEYEEAENEEHILNLEEKYEKVNTKRIRTNEILKIMKGK